MKQRLLRVLTPPSYLVFPRLFTKTSVKATAKMGQIKRGALIVLEGCDRSGKSSQAKRLLEQFQREKRRCILLRFPDRTTLIGNLINDYLEQKSQLDDRVIHHLFSANRWEFASKIKSSLQGGTSVLIDRYAYSGVAFSAAKQGMDLEWCKQPDVGLPRPDLVLFLDIKPQQASNRSGFGVERYENLEFQNQVYDNYLLLKENNWQIVNADRNFDDVNVELIQHIKNAINSIKDTKINGLWMPEITH